MKRLLLRRSWDRNRSQLHRFGIRDPDYQSGTTAISFETSPAGLPVSVDGGAAQAPPFTLNLTPGSHPVAVAATQPGTTGVQYAFSARSDSVAVSHSVTVGGSAATYTASFNERRAHLCFQERFPAVWYTNCPRI